MRNTNTLHDDRPLVEQAVTLLSDQLGVSTEQAYDMLGQEAMAYRVFLRDVAAVVVDAGRIERPLGALFDRARFDRRPWCERL